MLCMKHRTCTIYISKLYKIQTIQNIQILTKIYILYKVQTVMHCILMHLVFTLTKGFSLKRQFYNFSVIAAYAAHHLYYLSVHVQHTQFVQYVQTVQLRIEINRLVCWPTYEQQSTKLTTVNNMISKRKRINE